MLKKLVLVLSCACAMNTCLANNIADNVEADAEAAAAYNCLYDAQGRVIYASGCNKAYEYAGTALTAYREARATTDKRTANAKYTKAIKILILRWRLFRKVRNIGCWLHRFIVIAAV